MTKLALLLLLPVALYADAPKPTAFTFNNPRPACTMMGDKLILSRAWPYGSWEECAYAILSAAQQLDGLRDRAERELTVQKQLVIDTQKQLEAQSKKK